MNLKEVFDKVFIFLYELAYTILESEFVEKIGLQEVNPFILLVAIGVIAYSILYGLFNGLFKIYKRFKRIEELKSYKV